MNNSKKNPQNSTPFVDLIVKAAQEKLAEKITVVDCAGKPTTADFFIICQSESTVGNRAIADAVLDRCAANSIRPWRCEGEVEGRWILLDFTDVVVHIMLPELRAYYALEDLWRGVGRSRENRFRD